MSKAMIFAKRNIIEMVRDPLIYIFGILFPVFMLCLFALINNSIPSETNKMFSSASLIPGIIMFSYSFLILILSLLVSKDMKSNFMSRLFISPMKKKDYIIGYILPALLIGILQTITCLIFGFILSLILKREYISFSMCLLLIIEMVPMLLISILIGLLLGLLFNDNSAPALSSIFISATGILGGAWLNLDAIKGLEKIYSFLPFYPSTYLGRIITNAYHAFPNENGDFIKYTFDNKAIILLITYISYLIIIFIITLIVFRKKANKAN